jgi:hypothetical protein
MFKDRTRQPSGLSLDGENIIDRVRTIYRYTQYTDHINVRRFLLTIHRFTLKLNGILSWRAQYLVNIYASLELPQSIYKYIYIYIYIYVCVCVSNYIYKVLNRVQAINCVLSIIIRSPSLECSRL